MNATQSYARILQDFRILLPGVPARSNRGWFGYCSVVLFRMDRHWALFDTGHYADRSELLSALKSVQVSPEAIQFVVLSHLHFDHILNLPMFPNASVFLSQEEISHAERVLSGSCLDPAIVDFWSTLIEDRRIEVVHGHMQIDKEVKLTVLPGHTPGCMALMTDASPRTALCSDIIKNGWDVISGRPPSATLDDEQARSSMQYLTEHAEVLIPGHDRPFVLCEKGLQYLQSLNWQVHGSFFPRPREERLLEVSEGAGRFVKPFIT